MKHLALLLTFTFSSTAIGSNLVVNGDFETPIASGPTGISGVAQDIYFAGQSFGGWTVGAGSVDLARNLFFPFSGAQVVDLAGMTPGAIFQDVATLPGQDYRLFVAFAGNAGGSIPGLGNPNAVKMFRVDFGEFTTTGTYDTTGQSNDSLTYQEIDVIIPGDLITAASTRLSFTEVGQNSLFRGTLIDAIAITVVPEPSSPLLAASAALAGMGLRRRQ